MSRGVSRGKTGAEHRILILAYFFKKYLGCRIRNHDVSEYESTPDDKTYKQLRDLLEEKGLIKTSDGDGGVRFIELTPEGMAYVEGMLAGGLGEKGARGNRSAEMPELVFVKNLRLLSLFPAWVRQAEAMKFFKALALMYADGFFDIDAVPRVVVEMAEDVAEGDGKISERFARRLGIICREDYRVDGWEGLVEDVIDGYDILRKVAHLAYIWRFYRYSRLALHTVVRNAAFILLGRLGLIYSHMAAAVFGAAAVLLALVLGFYSIVLFTFAFMVWMVLFAVLVIAARLPTLPKLSRFIRNKGRGNK